MCQTYAHMYTPFGWLTVKKLTWKNERSFHGRVWNMRSGRLIEKIWYIQHPLTPLNDSIQLQIFSTVLKKITKRWYALVTGIRLAFAGEPVRFPVVYHLNCLHTQTKCVLETVEFRLNIPVWYLESFSSWYRLVLVSFAVKLYLFPTVVSLSCFWTLALINCIPLFQQYASTVGRPSQMSSRQKAQKRKRYILSRFTTSTWNSF